MIKLRCIILCHDVLAVRFAKFGVSADLMDNDAALLTLENVREPPVGESSA